MKKQTPGPKEYKYIPGIGHKLGNYILPEEIVERMKKLTERSKEIQKEIGFNLCIDKHVAINDNIMISTGMTCIGEKGCLSTIRKHTQECPSDKIDVGGFHTHPNRDIAHMSHADAFGAYINGIECVGANKEINCFIRKNDLADEDTYNKFKTLYDKMEKIDHQIELRKKKLGEYDHTKIKNQFFQDHFNKTKI